MMANEVNMYYRFTSDNEPSEEQLSVLMHEMIEEVREKNANLQGLIMENILREYQNAKHLFPNV
jgi:L-lysine 2,3-aminomutase